MIFQDTDQQPAESRDPCYNCGKAWDYHAAWLCPPHRPEIVGSKRSEIPVTQQYFIARMVPDRIKETEALALKGRVVCPSGRGEIVRVLVGGSIYTEVVFYSVRLDKTGDIICFSPCEVSAEVIKDISKGRDWIDPGKDYCLCGIHKSNCTYHR